MHPYRHAAPTAFWSRSVSSGFDPTELVSAPAPLIRAGDRVASAGSCFASNLVPRLERHGFTYLRTEARHPAFRGIPADNLGYDAFSAAYGNVYTARQLLQLLRRSTGQFVPREDRWHTDAGVIDPYRPGLRYHALTDREFDLLTRQHLTATRAVFATADVFVFTLGLTEAWMSTADGAVYPVCPGTVAGTFDPRRHVFINFSASEVTADLAAFVEELRAINPAVRLILTVSPVPLVATATSQHVLAASTYSKAVLRAAAEDLARQYPHVAYFPSFEIVTGPQTGGRYFADDHRTVTPEGIDVVMATFLACCERPAAAGDPAPGDGRGAGRRAWLSKAIADAECEEAMLG